MKVAKEIIFFLFVVISSLFFGTMLDINSDVDSNRPVQWNMFVFMHISQQWRARSVLIKQDNGCAVPIT